MQNTNKITLDDMKYYIIQHWDGETTQYGWRQDIYLEPTDEDNSEEIDELCGRLDDYCSDDDFLKVTSYEKGYTYSVLSDEEIIELYEEIREYRGEFDEEE